jgi:hypothetical protein
MGTAAQCALFPLRYTKDEETAVQLKITSKEDFYAGLMFIGFGVLAILIARNYPIGSAMRMGPGYFPTAIGMCLIVLGSVIALTGFRLRGEGVGRFAWRPLLLLAAAFSIFALTIESLGFIVALLVMVVLSAFAGQEWRVKEVIIEALLLVAACWLVFVYLLELPFPVWGR